MKEYLKVTIKRIGNNEIETEIDINMKCDALMIVIANLAARAEGSVSVEERAQFRASLMQQINEVRKELL